MNVTLGVHTMYHGVNVGWDLPTAFRFQIKNRKVKQEHLFILVWVRQRQTFFTFLQEYLLPNNEQTAVLYKVSEKVETNSLSVWRVPKNGASGSFCPEPVAFLLLKN